MRIILGYRASETEKNDFFAAMMPIGLGYVAGVLGEAGHDPLLVNFTHLGWPEIRKLLAREKPGMLGLTLYTFNRHTTMKLAALCREVSPQTVIVAGGPHASHCVESVLGQYPQIDYLVRGEGELTAVELVQALEGKRDPRLVPGLAFRERDGRIVQTPPRVPVADLDTLPFPHRHYDSIGVDQRAQFSYLITSRGCPARCTFCGTPDFWGQKIRYRSARNILQEIRELRERYGLIFFSIRDDTFSFNKKRVTDFCSALLEAKLDILWDCQSRVNAVDLERLQWMRRAGCEQIQYGVEHGAEPMMELLNKGTTMDQVERAAAATRQAGLVLSMYMITGIPGETEQHFQESLGMVERTRPHDIIPSRLGYLPGTALYYQAMRERGTDDRFWIEDKRSGVYVREDEQAKQFHRRLTRLAGQLPARNRYTREEFERQRAEMGDHYARDLAAAATYEADEDFAAAEAELASLGRREPENLWGMVRTGEFLTRRGRPAEAVPLFSRALDRLPQLAPARSLLGVALRNLGQERQAVQEFRRALSLDPCEPMALEELGG
ncbi:MAG: radical SAM protein [Candidatus Wallbacteria bacterium]|nr:radical SAM protein [Candidatus Wallbacteria bacterium]